MSPHAAYKFFIISVISQMLTRIFLLYVSRQLRSYNFEPCLLNLKIAFNNKQKHDLRYDVTSRVLFQIKLKFFIFSENFFF